MEVAYGWDLLAHEGAALRRPVVVTTASPWALARPRFTAVPAAVVIVESLERQFLDAVTARPVNGDVVVGIGGGMVMDAAKYVALHWKRPLVLVPTITSGNGPFTRSIAVREGGRPVGMRGDILANRVLVDYGLIREAPAVLNRSGIGDVLYLHTGEFDWRLAASRGKAIPWNEDAAKTMRQTVDRACAMSHEIGSVSPEGIRTIMEAFHTSAMLHEEFNHPQVGSGSEHLFAWNLEATTGQHFIHGQIVCLGIVIMAFLQHNEPEKVRSAIDTAQVPYQPDALGLTWADVERALVTIAEYNRSVRHFCPICAEVTWDPPALQKIRRYLSTAHAALGGVRENSLGR
jgi:glycerol-1-phosphate dehydrogenase [NAD(P)+]